MQPFNIKLAHIHKAQELQPVWIPARSLLPLAFTPMRLSDAGSGVCFTHPPCGRDSGTNSLHPLSHRPFGCANVLKHPNNRGDSDPTISGKLHAIGSHVFLCFLVSTVQRSNRIHSSFGILRFHEVAQVARINETASTNTKHSKSQALPTKEGRSGGDSKFPEVFFRKWNLSSPYPILFGGFAVALAFHIGA